MNELWTCMTRHDDDKDGAINEKEFLDFMTTKETDTIMKSMGVDMEG
eukprot:CAMPEP_0172877110 /NCGR_PEP_ID=MMETSP1075-20121228/106159_1 /TAXON_ID=2916 /ORGANISM="Ceratium fusus, Strain PA161109" /LENGTH=46 /DNA_ID= /DNA_START= /DNA_END= /DNA_ORIENTATION=